MRTADATGYMVNAWHANPYVEKDTLLHSHVPDLLEAWALYDRACEQYEHAVLWSWEEGLAIAEKG